MIQSGIAKLTMAKTSAAIKSVPDIKVNLSIAQVVLIKKYLAINQQLTHFIV